MSKFNVKFRARDRGCWFLLAGNVRIVASTGMCIQCNMAGSWHLSTSLIPLVWDLDGGF
jgi:hypothetical protein